MSNGKADCLRSPRPDTHPVLEQSNVLGSKPGYPLMEAGGIWVAPKQFLRSLAAVGTSLGFTD